MDCDGLHAQRQQHAGDGAHHIGDVVPPFDAAMQTIAPIDAIGCSSKIGFQVRPASIVSQTPPLTLPK